MKAMALLHLLMATVCFVQHVDGAGRKFAWVTEQATTGDGATTAEISLETMQSGVSFKTSNRMSVALVGSGPEELLEPPLMLTVAEGCMTVTDLVREDFHETFKSRTYCIGQDPESGGSGSETTTLTIAAGADWKMSDDVMLEGFVTDPFQAKMFAKIGGKPEKFDPSRLILPLTNITAENNRNVACQVSLNGMEIVTDGHGGRPISAVRLCAGKHSAGIGAEDCQTRENQVKTGVLSPAKGFGIGAAHPDWVHYQFLPFVARFDPRLPVVCSRVLVLFDIDPKTTELAVALRKNEQNWPIKVRVKLDVRSSSGNNALPQATLSRLIEGEIRDEQDTILLDREQVEKHRDLFRHFQWDFDSGQIQAKPSLFRTLQKVGLAVRICIYENSTKVSFARVHHHFHTLQIQPSIWQSAPLEYSYEPGARPYAVREVRDVKVTAKHTSGYVPRTEAVVDIRQHGAELNADPWPCEGFPRTL